MIWASMFLCICMKWDVIEEYLIIFFDSCFSLFIRNHCNIFLQIFWDAKNYGASEVQNKASRKKLNSTMTQHKSLAGGMAFLNLVYTHLQMVRQYSSMQFETRWILIYHYVGSTLA